tara:strand:+ start:625 stop:12894 length:12270 start_codon:yes stop_codon:yes gene_type:complete
MPISTNINKVKSDLKTDINLYDEGLTQEIPEQNINVSNIPSQEVISTPSMDTPVQPSVSPGDDKQYGFVDQDVFDKIDIMEGYDKQNIFTSPEDDYSAFMDKTNKNLDALGLNKPISNAVLIAARDSYLPYKNYNALEKFGGAIASGVGNMLVSGANAIDWMKELTGYTEMGKEEEAVASSVAGKIPVVGDVAKVSNAYKSITGIDLSSSIANIWRETGTEMRSWNETIKKQKRLKHGDFVKKDENGELTIDYSQMASWDFWLTDVAEQIPNIFMFIGTGVAGAAMGARALPGAVKLVKGVPGAGRVMGVGKKLVDPVVKSQFGQRTKQVGQMFYGSRFNPTLKGVGSFVGAGQLSSASEGVMIAADAFHEAKTMEGLTPEQSAFVASQVWRDNQNYWFINALQYGILTRGMPALMGKGVKLVAGGGFANKVAKFLIGGGTTVYSEGKLEEFQEVYQDWRVRTRLAEIKGEEFMGYWDYFNSPEMAETRVISFGAGFGMGAGAVVINSLADGQRILDRQIEASGFSKDTDSQLLFAQASQKIAEMEGQEGGEFTADEQLVVKKAKAIESFVLSVVTEGDFAQMDQHLAREVSEKRITEAQAKEIKNLATEMQEAFEPYANSSLAGMSPGHLREYGRLAFYVAKTKEQLSSQLEKFEEQKAKIESRETTSKNAEAQKKEELEILNKEIAKTKEGLNQDIAGYEDAMIQVKKDNLQEAEDAVAELDKKNKKKSEEIKLKKLREEVTEEEIKKAEKTEPKQDKKVTPESDRITALDKTLSKTDRAFIDLMRKKGKSEKLINQKIKDSAKNTASGNQLLQKYKAEDALANPEGKSKAELVSAYSLLYTDKFQPVQTVEGFFSGKDPGIANKIAQTIQEYEAWKEDSTPTSKLNKIKNKIKVKKRTIPKPTKKPTKKMKPPKEEGVIPTIIFGATSEVKNLYKVEDRYGKKIPQRHFGVEEVFRQRLKKMGANLIVFDHFAKSEGGRRYAGMAEGLSVFLNSRTATQETLFHELAHVYLMGQWSKPWVKALRNMVIGQKVFTNAKYKYSPALKFKKGDKTYYLQNIVRDSKDILTYEKWREKGEGGPKGYSVYTIDKAKALGYEILPDEEQRYIVEEAVVDLIAKSKDEQNIENLVDLKLKGRVLSSMKKLFSSAKGKKTKKEALDIFENTGNSEFLTMKDVLAEVMKDYNNQLQGKKGKFDFRINREGMAEKSNINQLFTTEEYADVKDYTSEYYEALEKDENLDLEKYRTGGILDATGKKLLRDHKLSMKSKMDKEARRLAKVGPSSSTEYGWSNEEYESYKERSNKYLSDSLKGSGVDFVKEQHDDDVDGSFIEGVLESKNKESKVISAFRKEFISLQGNIQGRNVQEKDLTKAIHQSVRLANGQVKSLENFEQDINNLISSLDKKDFSLTPQQEILARFMRFLNASYNTLDGYGSFNAVQDIHHEFSSIKRQNFYGYTYTEGSGKNKGKTYISMSLAKKIRGKGVKSQDQQIEKEIGKKLVLAKEDLKQLDSPKKIGRLKLISQFYGLRSKMMSIDKQGLSQAESVQKKKNIVSAFIYDNIIPEDMKEDVSVLSLYNTQAVEKIVSDNAFELLKETSMFNFRESKGKTSSVIPFSSKENENKKRYAKSVIDFNINQFKKYHRESGYKVFSQEEVSNIEKLIRFSMANPTPNESGSADFAHIAIKVNKVTVGGNIFKWGIEKGNFLTKPKLNKTIREISRSIFEKYSEQQFDTQIEYPNGESAALLIKHNQIDILQNKLDEMINESNPDSLKNKRELKRLFKGNRIIERWLDGKSQRPRVVPIIGSTIYKNGKRKGFNPGKTPPDQITVFRLSLIANAINNNEKTYSQNISDFGEKNTELHILNAELLSLEEGRLEAEKLGFDKKSRNKDIQEMSDLLLSVQRQRGYKSGIPSVLSEIGLTEKNLEIIKNLREGKVSKKDIPVDTFNRLSRLAEVLEQISVNNFINKHYAKDLYIGPMQYFGKTNQDIFTDYNKRGTGPIASHVTYNKDIRVEPILLNDIERKKLNRTDASSFILLSTAKKIAKKYGGLRKVGQHYKFVYYGQNLDNSTFEKSVGVRHPFYLKTNVFIITDEYADRHPNFKPLKEMLEERDRITGDGVVNVISFKSASKVNGVRASKGLDKKYLNLDDVVNKNKDGDWVVNVDKLNENQDNLFKYNDSEGVTQYGLDGSYFGVQTELDKKSRESTINKQLVLALFSNVNMKEDAEALITKMVDFFGKKYQNFFNKVVVGSKSDISKKLESIVDVVSENISTEAYGPFMKDMVESGSMDSGTYGAVRDIFLSQIRKKGLKMRAPGGIGHQSTDFAIHNGSQIEKLSESSGLSGGYLVGEEGDVQIEVSESFAKQHGYEVGDTLIFQRTPYSIGDAVVTTIAGFNKGQGSMVTIPSEVSDILGSDMDGDNGHMFGIYKKPKKNSIELEYNQMFEDLTKFLKDERFKSFAEFNINSFSDTIKKLEDKGFIRPQKIVDDRTIMGGHKVYRNTKEVGQLIGVSATFNNLQKILSAYNVSTPYISLTNIKYLGLSESYTDKNGKATESLALMLNAFLDNLNKGFATRLNMNMATFPIWSELVSRGLSFEKTAEIMTGDDFVLYAEMKERFPGDSDSDILKRIAKEKYDVDVKKSKDVKVGKKYDEMRNIVNAFNNESINSAKEVLRKLVNFDNSIPQTYIEAQDMLNNIVGLANQGLVNVSGLISVKKKFKAADLYTEMFNKGPEVLLNYIDVKESLVSRNLKKLIEITSTLKRTDTAYTGGYDAIINKIMPFGEKKKFRLFDTNKELRKLESIIRSVRLSKTGIYNYSTLWTSLNNLLGEDVYNIIQDGEIPLHKRFDIVLGYINSVKFSEEFSFINKYFSIVKRDEAIGYNALNKNFNDGPILSLTENGIVLPNVSVNQQIDEFYIKPNMNILSSVSKNQLKKDFAKLPQSIQDFLYVYDLEVNKHDGANRLLPYLQGSAKDKITKATSNQIVNSEKDLQSGNLSPKYINSVAEFVSLNYRGHQRDITSMLTEPQSNFAFIDGVRLSKNGNYIVVEEKADMLLSLFPGLIYKMDIASSNEKNISVLFRAIKGKDGDVLLSPIKESILRGEDQFISNMVEEESRTKDTPTLYMFLDDNHSGYRDIKEKGSPISPDLFMLIDDEQYFRKKDILDFSDYLNMREGRVVNHNNASEKDKKEMEEAYEKYVQDLEEVKGYTRKYLKKNTYGETPLEIEAKYKGKKGIEFIKDLIEKGDGNFKAIKDLDTVAADRLYTSLVKILATKESILGINLIMKRNKDLSPQAIENLKELQLRIRKGDKSIADVTSGDLWGNPDAFNEEMMEVAKMLRDIDKSEMIYRRELNTIRRKTSKAFNALLKSKFKESAGPLWWVMFGAYQGISYIRHFKTFNRHIFSNIAEEVEGYNAEEGRFYRELRLRADFINEDGTINKNNLYKKDQNGKRILSDAEIDYYVMYHGMTTMASNHLSTKTDMNGQKVLSGKQRLYIPNRRAGMLEMALARKLPATYISFNYDSKHRDINVKGYNPITGRTEVLPLKDFINYYQIAQSPKAIEEYRQAMKEEGAGVVKYPNIPPPPSDVKMTAELRKLTKQAEEYIKSGVDAAGKKALIAEEMESLTSQDKFSRHLSGRSSKSGYMASWDIQRSLDTYMAETMFTHGMETQTLDGKNFTYTGTSAIKPLIDGVIALNRFRGNEKVAKWAKELYLDRYVFSEEKKSLISRDGKRTAIDYVFQWLMSWTMLVGLALKPQIAVMNIAIGKYNEYRRSNLWDFAKAERRFWGIKNNFEAMKKTQAVSNYFNLIADASDQITEGAFTGYMGSFLFSPMIGSENYIQKAAFVGQFTDAQWDSFTVKDGVVEVKPGMNKYETTKSNEEVFSDLDKESAIQYKSNVYEVQGRGYTATDQRLVQNYFILDGLLQFKRWLPTYTVDRLGSERIDRFGKKKIGTLRATSELVKNFAKDGVSVETFNKLPDFKQEAVKRMWRGAQGAVGLFILIALASGMDDESDDNPIINNMWSLTGDMFLLMNISKLRHMVVPPVLRTADNITSGLYFFAKGAEYERDTKYFKKGDSKAKGSFIKGMPMFARRALIRKED